MEQEYAQPEETTQKKNIRNFTEERREKQKLHLETIRKNTVDLSKFKPHFPLKNLINNNG